MRIRFLFALLVSGPALAQQPYKPAALTNEDYTRAEKYLTANTGALVLRSGVRANWLPDGRFWYRNTIAEGAEFVMVDPVKRTRVRAFDQARLAGALTAESGTTYDAYKLPITQFDIAQAGQSIQFDIGQRRFTCDVLGNRCAGEARQGEAAVNPGGRGGRGGNTASVSPDGRRAVFIRDYNLWVRDVQSGREQQLTTDGVKDFGYATDNAGWTKSDRAIVAWSPDSKKVATYQQDERKVGEMYLVNTTVGHPTLQAWKYPLPGDSVIQMIHRVVIDLEAPRVVRFQMGPDAHRSTLCDHIVCGGELADVEWYPDGSKVAFVSSTRDHKQASLRIADATTGAIRDVLQEKVATQFESGSGRVNWHVLPASNEVIWFSERDDWGNLYLYDLATGQLEHQITRGPGLVLQLIKIDEKNRVLYFTGAGREEGRDPYFRHLYRIGFDGKNERLLTPEDANHDATLSPDGRYILDAYSRPDVPPVTVLRDLEGRLLLTLERADITRLLATGWTPPIPFSVKGRDGKTDLHGLMYRPTNFDSTKKYPIVNNIYPGPQSGSVGSRSFSPSRGDTRAIAELGFIVIQLDGMGTPARSKSFHDAYYGNMGDNTLPDQITGMKQLAERYGSIDIDRAGIYGHSGGGFATADAMFRYPDFFKVGVSQAGNHDNRNYEDDWGERYQGLLEAAPNGTTNYDDQANQNLAKNLKGKLLIAHGTLDNNVPPYNTLMVVNELIKYNKDFDLILFPNRPHGFGGEAYMTRRRWDYFVKHLLGAEPPKEYTVGRPIS